MESNYTKSILNKFSDTFSESWIENLEWSRFAKKAYAEGLQTINGFREFTVVQFSKLLLSGDHLINETNAIGDIQSKLNGYIEDIIPRKVLKIKLQIEYQSMLKDLIDIIRMVKNHIEQTKKKFSPNNLVISANFVSYKNRTDRHKMVSLMHLICDSCEVEYSFSYDESYINHLLLIRQYLLDEKQKQNGELKNVIIAVLTKVELLLGKMSVFTENKKILYYHDWELETIELDRPDKYLKGDFRFLFQKYLDPSGLDDGTIIEWQQDSLKDEVAMWQLAFLMRYYTKCTKSIIQINKLIDLACRHHDEYIRDDKHNIVNDCADRSFLNYMYNSRFSFLCQCDKDYTYVRMKEDLQEIESIQSQTFIKNYHPYQTAVEFTIKVIETKISQMVMEDITQIVSDLKEYFRKFKLNVLWCKKHQPYLVQLRYNFSSIEIENCDFKTFCPSSFCRPLRFKDLDEKTIAYANKIAFFENESYNQHNRSLFLETKSKIDNMERKNMEQMGLFITITTFLVGLLSIFIGNNGSVTIKEKMQYVVALGCILIIFVSVGYYFVRDKHSKTENCILGGIIFILVLSLWNFSNVGSNKINATSGMNVQMNTSLGVDTTYREHPVFNNVPK